MSISKKSAINTSKVLSEALPFIQKFSGKTIVIKYGGSAMQDSFLRKSFARDVVLMKTVGINPVIVHGGGPQIGKELDRHKLSFKFKNGIRVTTPETIKVIQKVLDLQINPEIKNLNNTWGGQGKSFAGEKMSLIKAIKSKKRS